MADKKKVLVIDDDDNLRTVLVDKLNASGYEADGAMDGEDGLTKALAQHPDVVLLDVMMPKMDGWEVLQNMREDAWGKSAKVIMLTVLENLDHVARGVEMHIEGYLVKTNWSLDDIVKHVEEAANK